MKIFLQSTETFVWQFKERCNKAERRTFIMQPDNDLPYTAKTAKFIRRKRWKVLDWPSPAPELKPIELHLSNPQNNDWKSLNASQNKNAEVWSNQPISLLQWLAREGFSKIQSSGPILLLQIFCSVTNNAISWVVCPIQMQTPGNKNWNVLFVMHILMSTQMFSVYSKRKGKSL